MMLGFWCLVCRAGNPAETPLCAGSVLPKVISKDILKRRFAFLLLLVLQQCLTAADLGVVVRGR